MSETEKTIKDLEKIIKDLEYARYLLGIPDQGEKWWANAQTIAIDCAIQITQEKLGRKKHLEPLPEKPSNSIGSCADCFHEDIPVNFFPCNECARTHRYIHDLYTHKPKEET